MWSLWNVKFTGYVHCIDLAAYSCILYHFNTFSTVIKILEFSNGTYMSYHIYLLGLWLGRNIYKQLFLWYKSMCYIVTAIFKLYVYICFSPLEFSKCIPNVLEKKIGFRVILATYLGRMLYYIVYIAHQVQWLRLWCWASQTTILCVL